MREAVGNCRGVPLPMWDLSYLMGPLGLTQPFTSAYAAPRNWRRKSVCSADRSESPDPDPLSFHSVP